MEKFSYSKLDTYCQCPFKYYLKYVLKNYIPAKSIALDVGILLHKTEEQIFNFIKAGTQIDYVNLKNNFIVESAAIEMKYPEQYNSRTKSGKTYKEEMYSYLSDGIYRLEQFHVDHPEYEFTAAEKPFEIRHDDICFTGAIDRIFRNKDTGEYLIEDIKSYHEKLPASKLKSPLQFIIYSLAVGQLYGISEKGLSCKYDMPFINLVQPTETQKNFNSGLAELKDIFSGITSKDYHCNASPLCHFCEYCITNKAADLTYLKEHDCFCVYFSHWTREQKSFSVENSWTGLENFPLLEKLFKKQYLL